MYSNSSSRGLQAYNYLHILKPYLLTRGVMQSFFVFSADIAEKTQVVNSVVAILF